jgi:putative tryptophan/tyrosine transport system substrate-binding protein
MKRYLLAVALLLLWVPNSGEVRAQDRKAVARIGYLSVRADPIPEPIRAGFRDLGYVEGRDFVFEVRSAEGQPDRLMKVAAELVALKVQVILTRDGRSALAAGEVTTTVPIVFATSGDAVGQGLVKNIARPERNLTGFTNASPDIAGKRLELLTKAFPGITRVAALTCPGLVSEKQWRETQVAAEKLKLGLIRADVRSPDEADLVLKRAQSDGAEAMVVFDCSAFPDRIALADVRGAIPRLYPYDRFMKVGGLMYYGPDEDAHYYRSASYVDRILKGAKPSDLPVEQPTKFRLVVNLKTAHAMGLIISSALLDLADEVIE